ncbi:MAG: hypothetical protein H6512_05540 [Acidimicrobiia bacterium]|nr:hypothetical protein [Acidimicrobiia bacterium]
MIIAFSLFAALLARLWFLQIVSYEAYALEADENRTRELEYAGPRGRILDRNGEVIVENRLANVIAISGDVDDDELEAAANALAPVLGQAPHDIVERYRLKREVPYAPVVVAGDVPDETMLYIAERRDEFANIEAHQRVIRAYPRGNTAAHVIGTLGGIEEDELDELTAQGYLPNERIGKSGMEAAYDTALHGTPWVEVVEVDRQNRAVRTVDTVAAIPGDDVVSTLDLDVQLAAERVASGDLRRTYPNRPHNSAKTYERLPLARWWYSMPTTERSLPWPATRPSNSPPSSIRYPSEKPRHGAIRRTIRRASIARSGPLCAGFDVQVDHRTRWSACRCDRHRHHHQRSWLLRHRRTFDQPPLQRRSDAIWFGGVAAGLDRVE